MLHRLSFWAIWCSKKIKPTEIHCIWWLKKKKKGKLILFQKKVGRVMVDERRGKSERNSSCDRQWSRSGGGLLGRFSAQQECFIWVVTSSACFSQQQSPRPLPKAASCRPRPDHITSGPKPSRRHLRHSPCCYIKNFTRFSPTKVNIFFKWLLWIASHPRSASTLDLFFFTSDIHLRTSPPSLRHSDCQSFSQIKTFWTCQDLKRLFRQTPRWTFFFQKNLQIFFLYQR